MLRSRTGIASLVAAAVGVALLLWPRPGVEDGGERVRAELDLRDGILYIRGEDVPFTGKLVEDYGRDARKLAIGIRDGKADGLSRGWFEDGQPEIEETFLDGVSNGVRTRWYPGGTKKSTATIRDGVIVGSYVTWHDNGQKAAEVDMVDGQPHGLAEAWHPNGRLKSRVQLDHGVPSHTEFFPETGAIAGADNPPTAR